MLKIYRICRNIKNVIIFPIKKLGKYKHDRYRTGTPATVHHFRDLTKMLVRMDCQPWQIVYSHFAGVNKMVLKNIGGVA